MGKKNWVNELADITYLHRFTFDFQFLYTISFSRNAFSESGTQNGNTISSLGRAAVNKQELVSALGSEMIDSSAVQMRSNLLANGRNTSIPSFNTFHRFHQMATTLNTYLHTHSSDALFSVFPVCIYHRSSIELSEWRTLGEPTNAKNGSKNASESEEWMEKNPCEWKWATTSNALGKEWNKNFWPEWLCVAASWVY